MLINIKKTKKEIILIFHFKKSDIKKNKAIPRKALIVFDLSPVINIPIKLINIINKIKILEPSLFFFKLSISYPNIIKINPVANAPATGSVLKKLTTLGPCG